jgi:hypothetical protein
MRFILSFFIVFYLLGKGVLPAQNFKSQFMRINAYLDAYYEAKGVERCKKFGEALIFLNSIDLSESLTEKIYADFYDSAFLNSVIQLSYYNDFALQTPCDSDPGENKALSIFRAKVHEMNVTLFPILRLRLIHSLTRQCNFLCEMHLGGEQKNEVYIEGTEILISNFLQNMSKMIELMSSFRVQKVCLKTTQEKDYKMCYSVSTAKDSDFLPLEKSSK